MAYQHYDRLTALDNSFLDLESPGVHMHVGSVGIFDPGPLAGPDEGGLDFDEVLTAVEAGLYRAPRLRQRLERTPVTGHPVWVDDAHFNTLYHVRHTALPLPGDDRQLKRLVGRIMSEKLDRHKPMWELWFVEGLASGRIAVISKIHHCLIDGLSGVDLLSSFMNVDPEYRAVRSEHRWMPRPSPSAFRLLGEEVGRRASLPGRVAAGVGRALQRPAETLEETAHAASGLADTLASATKSASETPFNVPIGPHRRFDWTAFDLGVVKEIRGKLGGTLNDVVLACVAGAVRFYLRDHELRLSGIDFRAYVPVSTRQAGDQGKLGNHVSMLIASLPVGERDPRKRLERISEETRKLKASGQVAGSEIVELISDWTSTALLTSIERMAASRRASNLVVTNVPGPQVPIFMNGARMLESYPVVPLFDNNALGVALFSYDGKLFWGFNADWDAIPDLHEFVLAIEREFEVLRKL